MEIARFVFAQRFGDGSGLFQPPAGRLRRYMATRTTSDEAASWMAEMDARRRRARAGKPAGPAAIARFMTRNLADVYSFLWTRMGGERRLTGDAPDGPHAGSGSPS